MNGLACRDMEGWRSKGEFVSLLFQIHGQAVLADCRNLRPFQHVIVSLRFVNVNGTNSTDRG